MSQSKIRHLCGTNQFQINYDKMSLSAFYGSVRDVTGIRFALTFEECPAEIAIISRIEVTDHLVANVMFILEGEYPMPDGAREMWYKPDIDAILQYPILKGWRVKLRDR